MMDTMSESDLAAQGFIAAATRETARAVILACCLLVIPVRVWQLVAVTALPVYRLFPWWLQVATIAAFAWQGVAVLTGRRVARLTALACVISCAVAVVQGVADFHIGAWVWWSCMAAIQGYTYWQLITRGGAS